MFWDFEIEMSFGTSDNASLHHFLSMRSQVSKTNLLRLQNSPYFAAGDSSVGFGPCREIEVTPEVAFPILANGRKGDLG